MALRPIIKFYLLHIETGQRYAIADHEIVIGRTSGDVLFPDDAGMAPAQCRVRPSEDGLIAQDAIAPDQAVRLVDGDRLTVGAQAFTVIKVTRATPRPPRPRRATTPDSRVARAGLTVLVACAIGLVTYALRGHAPTITSAPTMVQLDGEIEQLLATYRTISTVAEEDIPARLRRDLIPGLERMQGRLGQVAPAATDQRRHLEGRRRLVATLLRQTRAMASFYETGDPNVERVLDEASRELASLRGEAAVGTRRAKLGADEFHTAPPPRK